MSNGPCHSEQELASPYMGPEGNLGVHGALSGQKQPRLGPIAYANMQGCPKALISPTARRWVLILYSRVD